MLKVLPACLLMLVSFGELNAQYYIKGQEPASTKWLELKTQRGQRIIYPSDSDSISRKFGYYLDQVYRLKRDSLEINLKPIPAIIHPNSLLSNGFVSWAPKRMEVVSTTAYDNDPEPWLKTLTFHETQHVIQVESLDRGFFKGLSFLIGQQAQGIAVGFVPLWFIEGDAIYNETIHTLGGRGRDAGFYKYYRTHILSNNGRKFNYDKWLLSSYKDVIPNHYQLGYQIVGYTNLKYGSKVWSNTLKYISLKPFTIFPFYFGLKKQTGLSRQQLFDSTFSYLETMWEPKQCVENPKTINLIKNRVKKYVEFQFPYLINDSILLSFKKEPGRIPVFVSINTLSGKETILHHPGIVLGKVSYQNLFLIWAQYRAHPRWEYLNYGEIWIMNSESGQANRITKGTSYINPVFYNQHQILTIEHNPSGQSNLVLIDLNGNIIKSRKLPQGVEPKEIAVSTNGSFVVRGSTEEGTKFLLFKNILTAEEVVFGPLFRHISNISFAGESLFFIMSNGYKNDVFSLDLQTRRTFQITNSIYGVGDVSYYNDKELIISKFDINGYSPVKIIQTNDDSHPFNIEYKVKGLFQEDEAAVILPYNQIIDTLKFTQKKHQKVSKLFNFHSWAPLYYNPHELMNGQGTIYPGVSLFSQNLTSTALTTLGYSYNQTHGLHANFQWMGWYPVISAGVDVGNKYPIYIGGPNSLQKRTEETKVKYDILVTVPLRLSSGRFVSQLSPGVKYASSNDMVWNEAAGRYNKSLDNASAYLVLYSLQRMAHRDIRSKYGFYLYTTGGISPSQLKVIGRSTLIRSMIYFPGVAVNHSLLISLQHERHDTKKYFHSNSAYMPRGYSDLLYEKYQSVSADYTFPILYPDFRVGPLIYIKRIFLNAFYDKAILDQYIKIDENAYVKKAAIADSFGIEIYSDTHFFRTRYEFRLGYRVGVNKPGNVVFSSFLLSLNMNSIYGFLSNNQIVSLNL